MLLPLFRMRSLYDCKWCVFEEWYEGCKLKSYQCSVSDILFFPKDLVFVAILFQSLEDRFQSGTSPWCRRLCLNSLLSHLGNISLKLLSVFQVSSAPGLGISQALNAFHSPPISFTEDQRLNALCPVRALWIYLDRTSSSSPGAPHTQVTQFLSNASLTGLWKLYLWNMNLRECNLQGPSEHTPLCLWALFK